MPLKELHEQIIKGNYHGVEKIILEESINPLAAYNDRTAIQLCYVIQSRLSLADSNVYREMLDNILFPQTDRWLIGNGRANRGDTMLVEDSGAIQVLAQGKQYDESASVRIIGLDDHRLSEEFRISYLNNEMAYRK